MVYPGIHGMPIHFNHRLSVLYRIRSGHKTSSGKVPRVKEILEIVAEHAGVVEHEKT